MPTASTLIAIGIPPTEAEVLGFSNLTPVGASGTTQGTATAIKAFVTQVEVTAASNQTGVRLPADVEFMQPYLIFNSSATTAQVYPPVGGSINGGSANDPVTLVPNDALIFVRIDQTRWLGGSSGASTQSVSPAVGGRLTLATGVPVMFNGSRTSSTVFFTPFRGQAAPLWTGKAFRAFDYGGELSQLTADTTKSPAAVVANSNYDVFLWTDNGTYRATRGPAWTSNTARGTGVGSSELELLKGIYVNKVAITNGPAARFGLYLGSFHSNASATVNFIFGGLASGGSAGDLGVWNNFNRVLIGSYVFDTGTSYTYTSATVRQARDSTGNQISFMNGQVEDAANAWSQQFGQTLAVAGATELGGLGYDGYTVYTTGGEIVSPDNGAGLNPARNKAAITTWWSAVNNIGYHFYALIQSSDGTNANNFGVFGGDQLSFNFPM